MLQIGSLVDNKYKILSEVGHGGMSVVYLAINERANKTWAVKEIRKDGVCDFEAVKQGLVVETDMLKKLNHSHLPSIIDVIDTDDSFLIVMDYIEGKSLQSVLKNGGAQPTGMVIEWGKQLCDVLGYLHSREPAIIYRDMKPANVMLKPDGNITLIDFGTAREFKNRTMVEDTTCLGTRGYAAPEQFGGRGQTDARTDIYCLGATLYHLITGHSPAEPPYEIKPLSYWDPSFAGSGLEIVINKCCQQDPDARYQTCAELMYDLEHVSDMDYSTKLSRKRKWGAFIGSIALCAVGLIGMLGFHLAKNGATAQTYDAYINQAQMVPAGTDIGEYVDLIKSAIEIDPGRADAYIALIDKVEEDNYLDITTELDPIRQCLGGTTKGKNTTNEEILLRQDKAGYAEVQYRIGRLLFLMSDGSENNLKDSVVYFRKALDQGEMTDANKVKIAQSLSNIGSHIDTMDQSKNPYGESTGYSYIDLWQELKSLYMDYPVDSMGQKSYGITLYNRIVSLIGYNYSNFYAEGVKVEEMESLLNSIAQTIQGTKENLNELEIKRGYKTLIDSVEAGISRARQKLTGLKGGR